MDIQLELKRILTSEIAAIAITFGAAFLAEDLAPIIFLFGILCLAVLAAFRLEHYLKRAFPPECPACEYDLRGSKRFTRCPECGADLTASEHLTNGST